MATPAGQLTVTLTAELEQFVRDKVREGTYSTTSEYIRDVVRERYLRERDRASRYDALDAALARGLADAEAGRVVPATEAFARIRQSLGIPDGEHSA